MNLNAIIEQEILTDYDNLNYLGEGSNGVGTQILIKFLIFYFLLKFKMQILFHSIILSCKKKRKTTNS